MTLEYLTSNSLNKYPFSDHCSLVSNSSYVLKNDVFLDLSFCAKRSQGYKVYLTRFVNDIVGHNIILHFNVRDTSGTLLETDITFTIPHVNVVEKTMVYRDTTTWNVRVVPGAGMVAIVTAGNAVDETFPEANAEFAESALIFPPPRVSSVSFYNGDTLFTTISGSELVDTDLELEEGANTSFNLIGSSAVVDVIPGAGTGLYNPCDGDLVIKTINSVGSDPFGNFLFITDDCYTTTPEEHGIFVDNICTPKCTEEQFSNFAHYLNRIKDGIKSVADLATTLANELKTQISDYEASVVPNKNKPYHKISVAKFAGPVSGGSYYSFVVGFFNPKDTDILVSCSATGGGGTYVAGSYRYKSAQVVEDLGSASITGKTVPCIGVSRFEFVILGPSSGTVTVSGTLDSVAFSDNIVLT